MVATHLIVIDLGISGVFMRRGSDLSDSNFRNEKKFRLDFIDGVSNGRRKCILP